MEWVVVGLIMVSILCYHLPVRDGKKVKIGTFQFNKNFTYVQYKLEYFVIDSWNTHEYNHFTYNTSLFTTNLDQPVSSILVYGIKGITKYRMNISQCSSNNSCSEETKCTSFDIPNDPSRVQCSDLNHINCQKWNVSTKITPNIYNENASCLLRLKDLRYGSCIFPTVNFTIFVTNLKKGEFDVFVEDQIVNIMKFEISMRKVQDQVFNTSELCFHGKEFETRNETISPQSGKVLHFQFFDLKPGNYCFILKPMYKNCNKSLQPLHSEVCEIPVPSELLLDKNERKNVLKKINMVVIGIVVSVLLLLGFFCSCVLRYYYQYHNYSKRFTNILSGETCTPFLVVPEERERILITNGHGPRWKVLTIIYTQEIKEIIDCITKLVHFLRLCSGLVIRLDIEDDANVRSKLFSWYKEGDLFILCETEGSVVRERSLVESKITFHIDGDMLDDFFIQSLNCIINDTNSIGDFSKYIVVHFSFTPTIFKFLTIPVNKRYIISQQLAQLCHFLKYEKELLPTNENLTTFNRQWEHCDEYVALMDAIAKASIFVNRNKNYVEDVIKIYYPE